MLYTRGSQAQNCGSSETLHKSRLVANGSIAFPCYALLRDYAAAAWSANLKRVACQEYPASSAQGLAPRGLAGADGAPLITLLPCWWAA